MKLRWIAVGLVLVLLADAAGAAAQAEKKTQAPTVLGASEEESGGDQGGPAVCL